MASIFDRRQFLTIGAAAAATAALIESAGPAKAANNSDELIKKFTGGKTPGQGRVKLDLPEIAENGNTVPMTVSVESPMTEQSHVTDVLVVADGNPNAGVATFHFSPASGVAEANTRMRLATTQDVIAIAKMSDGSFFMASKQVKVTIGGCGGGTAPADQASVTRRNDMADVKPRIKLDKKEAKQGDLIEVKALVSHIMETGQRKDSAGNTIPRKILNKFTCTVNGKEVFSADFEPAISANPYIQFKFRAQESGPVVLTWIDDDGSKIVGEESITVS